jgi:hypothetical protein
VEDWVQYMIYFLIERHEDALRHLENHATTGVDLREEPTLHYSGNFWWANASHVCTLPNPDDFNSLERYPNPLESLRHNQEFWVCYNRAKHARLWDSSISCYERHLHLYPRNIYFLTA